MIDCETELDCIASTLRREMPEKQGSMLGKFPFGWVAVHYSLPYQPSLLKNIFCPVQKTVRAMYDYSSADMDEVSFKDGDVIVNVQSIDEGWMYGTVQRSGKTGMLPANYVEAI